MADLIALDPGDRWSAAAFFDVNPEAPYGWECIGAVEFEDDNEGFIDALAEEVLDNTAPSMVYEKWRLYEDKALEQTGKEFEAVQLIGQIKFIVRRHNEHCYMHTRALNAGQMTTCELRGMSCQDRDIGWTPTRLYEQPAEIQKPTAGILRGKKIKSVAKPIDKELYKSRGHVVSAELHGWYWILEGSVTGKKCKVIQE